MSASPKHNPSPEVTLRATQPSRLGQQRSNPTG
jgi:hypothetical protein